jgi:EmrB/QacA subfamily drug resistance transporter
MEPPVAEPLPGVRRDATLSPRPVEAEHAALDLPTAEKLVVVGAVMLGLFLGALDQTIVGVALPRIVSDLHGSDLYTWVVTAYLVTSTITVPIYGKLGDVFGRQRILIVGIVIFLAGSALSGLSQTMGELIIFRAIQGLGAGALFPISLAVIGDLFTPRERGRYQGLFGAVFGVSFLVGPFLGGYITDNISWHWIFYVNLPVGVLALIAISTQLPNVKTAAARLADLDYLGVVLFTAAVVPLLLGLTFKGLAAASGSLYSWTDPRVGGLILLSAVLFALFLVNESRARHPIIPLDLFTSGTLTAANIAVFMISCAMFGVVIFLPVYYQVVRGISATASGYSMWPLLLGLIGTSVGAGIVMSRTGRYKLMLLVATAVLIVGTFLLTHLSASTPTPLLWLWLALVGLGIGPSMSIYTVVVQNAAPRERLGTATSTLTFLRQVGGAVGLAVAGTMFSQSLTTELPKQLAAAHLPASLVAGISKNGGGLSENNLDQVGNLGQTILNSVPASARAGIRPFLDQIVNAIHGAISLAVGAVFWLALVTAVLAFLATMALRELPLRTSMRHSAEEVVDIREGSDADGELDVAAAAG